MTSANDDIEQCRRQRRSGPGRSTARLPSGLDLVSGKRLAHVDITYETWGELDEHGSQCRARLPRADRRLARGDRSGRARCGEARLVGRHGRARARRSTRTSTSSSAATCSAAVPARPARARSTRAPSLPYGLTFPLVTIEDMVNAQAALLDRHRRREAPGGRRRVGRRDAGARVGEALSAARAHVHRRRVDTTTRRAGHRLQRGRPAGDSRRPQLPRRRLLRQGRSPSRGSRSRGWSATSPTCPTSRCAPSSAGGCRIAPTTHSTSSPSSRSRATSRTRAASSSSDSTPTPTCT